MGTIETFQLTKDEMEDWLDTAKASITASLAREGFLDWEDVEEWSKTHTVILRKKNFFRSVSNVWNKEEEVKGYYLLVVKLPESVEEEDDEDVKEPLPLKEKDGKVVELKRREV